MTRHPAPLTATDPVIWTGSQYVNLTNPDPATLDLGEIARALSHVGRFCGMTERHYSVAEHSILCFDIAERLRAPLAVRRAALLHDAAEAYLGDVSSPLKALLPDYRRIEERFEAALFNRFRISLPLLQSRVRRIDQAALALEKRAFFPDAGPWGCDVAITPEIDDIAPPDFGPWCAAEKFLELCRWVGVS